MLNFPDSGNHPPYYGIISDNIIIHTLYFLTVFLIKHVSIVIILLPSSSWLYCHYITNSSKLYQRTHHSINITLPSEDKISNTNNNLPQVALKRLTLKLNSVLHICNEKYKIWMYWNFFNQHPLVLRSTSMFQTPHGCKN